MDGGKDGDSERMREVRKEGRRAWRRDIRMEGRVREEWRRKGGKERE